MEIKKTNEAIKKELMQIPGVGKSIAQDFLEMGYTSVESLKGQNPQEMYDQHCFLKGCIVDRCFLYVCRCAVYYASNSLVEMAILERP